MSYHGTFGPGLPKAHTLHHLYSAKEVQESIPDIGKHCLLPIISIVCIVIVVVYISISTSIHYSRTVIVVTIRSGLRSLCARAD